MSCDNCKQKRDFKNEIYESTKIVEKKVLVFVIIWFLLGLYGLYSLITKLL